MAQLQDFSKIAPYLGNPLVLIGFTLFLCLGVYKRLLKSGVLPQVSKAASAKIMLWVVNYTFIIAFLLVLFGFGFVAWKSDVNATFPLTVYVHGEHGPQDLPLRKSGKVVLRLGLEPRSEPIGADGEAFFPAVPATFRNQPVPIWVESDDFEIVQDSPHTLTPPSTDITVHKKSGKVSGRIEKDTGTGTFVPIPGAEIRIAGVTVNAGPAGEFEVTIPGDRMQPQLDIDVSAPGYTPAHTKVVPNSNPAVITLARVP
jgi:hypothetical protein